MTNKTIITYIIICFSLFSCIGERKSEQLIKLEKDFATELDQLELSNSVLITEDAKSYHINIIFEGKVDDTSSSYFLDDESNSVITSLLNHNFYNSLKIKDSIYYQLTFEEYMESTYRNYSRKDITKHYTQYKYFPRFRENVKYALVEMKYHGVIGADQTMSFLNEQSKVFNYKGSFWNFLQDFSVSCKNPSDNLGIVAKFIWFTGIYNDPEFPKNSNEKPEAFTYFCSSCGYPDSFYTEKWKDPEELVSDIVEIYSPKPE